MTTSWTGSVSVGDDGPVRIVRIEHEPRNLLNPGVMEQLRSALLAASDDEAVEGVILTGSGDVFCGGLDVPAIQAGADPIEFAEHLVALLSVFPSLTKPVVAAVNGDAVASGASLVAASDFAAAVPTAKVGTYEVSVGIWPFIAQVPIVQRVGARAAMENVGAGEPFSAQRAREVGLVQRVVDDGDDLLSECRGWLEAASRATAVYGIGRRSLYELAELPYAEALSASLALFVGQFDGDAR
jgi:enoyl-CoA hydratase/carnithine racemase